ncbi:hypothetical protein [Pseudomonas sp. HLMP]|uniref:hypothetical protein n=1 Tax=Pseudomonas sp. HLMP TaxID=3153767 RepID=UPI003967602B
MSNIHDQAMHYIYQQVLERLLAHMSQAQRASLQLLIQRLLVAAGGPEHIGRFQLLVVHGGDRRSAHLLASLRAAQLSIAVRTPDTFRLRVLVACLPYTGQEALGHHERCFSALFLQDDPRVELLMMADDSLQPFDSRSPVAMRPWASARETLLLFGHLAERSPEALLGSRLHLQLANAVRLALGWNGGASALVTALPERQRRRYLAWGRRVLRLAGEPAPQALAQCAAALAEGLGRLQALADAPLAPPANPAQPADTEAPLRVIAVDDLLRHMLAQDGLDRMLGCQAVGQAALAGCFEPHLVASLRHLQARLTERYAQRQPARLSLREAQRGWAQRAHEPERARFLQAQGLDEAQLGCLLFAPFAERGRGLAFFVQCCHPRMRVALPYLHRALQGKPCPEAVKRWLVDISGLSLAQLQAIYLGRLEPSASRLLAGLARRSADLRWLACPSSAWETVRQAAP